MLNLQIFIKRAGSKWTQKIIFSAHIFGECAVYFTQFFWSKFTAPLLAFERDLYLTRAFGACAQAHCAHSECVHIVLVFIASVRRVIKKKIGSTSAPKFVGYLQIGQVSLRSCKHSLRLRAQEHTIIDSLFFLRLRPK